MTLHQYTCNYRHDIYNTLMILMFTSVVYFLKSNDNSLSYKNLLRNWPLFKNFISTAIYSVKGYIR